MSVPYILWIFVLPSVLSCPPTTPQRPDCAGREQIGGVSTFPDIAKYPWMVSLGYEEEGTWSHYCGGAVISDDCIVTAAHCIFGKDLYKIDTQVMVGNTNFSDTSLGDQGKIYEILAIIKHPSYQGPNEYGEGYGPKGDLALVFTKTKITHPKVTQIPLIPANANLIDEQNYLCTKFSGWGWYDATHTASNALRAADFSVFPKSICMEHFPNPKIQANLNSGLLICAGADGISWTCKGDSGSPLVVYHNHEYYLIGILHGSDNCTFPSLFANLEHQENRGFVEDWMHMGDKLKKWYQVDRTANYLRQLQPNPPFQSLWSLYNEEIINQQGSRWLADRSLGSIGTPAPPKPWSFIETHLDGGKVLSARYDGTHVVMWGKSYGSDHEYELWRLENNGCLRNKKYPKKCLGTGAQLRTEHDFLESDQKWKFDEGILERETDTHVLNVIWADVSLVTDGAGVNIVKRDGTTSMYWRFVEP